METDANEIAELIEDTLGITGVRAHALGVFNEIYFRVEISRFGAADSRTYLVCIADGDPEHVTSTYMLNRALLRVFLKLGFCGGASDPRGHRT